MLSQTMQELLAALGVAAALALAGCAGMDYSVLAEGEGEGDERREGEPPTGPGITEPGLRESPSIRTPGSHTFYATPTTAGGTITWTLRRGSASNLEGVPTSWTEVETAQGAEATFTLNSQNTNFRVYRVEATDGQFTHNADIHVIKPNQRLQFDFESPGAPSIPVYMYAPQNLSAASHLIFVFHGASRNANDYCDRWSTYPDAGDALVVCPRFDKNDWSGSAKYNLGNVFSSVSSDGTTGSLRSEEAWSFTVTESLHAWVKERFDLEDKKLDVWGHSAGGQFSHRLAMFRHHMPFRYVIPANPGWWTLPQFDYVFPYGLENTTLQSNNLPFSSNDLQLFTRHHLVLMAGELDNDPGASSLRRNSLVDSQQGTNRFDRSQAFYDYVKQVDPQSPIVRIPVPGVGHDGAAMALAAIEFLTGPDATLPFD